MERDEVGAAETEGAELGAAETEGAELGAAETEGAELGTVEETEGLEEAFEAFAALVFFVNSQSLPSSIDAAVAELGISQSLPSVAIVTKTAIIKVIREATRLNFISEY